MVPATIGCAAPAGSSVTENCVGVGSLMNSVWNASDSGPYSQAALFSSRAQNSKPPSGFDQQVHDAARFDVERGWLAPVHRHPGRGSMRGEMNAATNPPPAATQSRNAIDARSFITRVRGSTTTSTEARAAGSSRSASSKVTTV